MIRGLCSFSARGADQHLNHLYKQFLFFVAEFKLFDTDEMEPMKVGSAGPRVWYLQKILQLAISNVFSANSYSDFFESANTKLIHMSTLGGGSYFFISFHVVLVSK